MAQRSKITRNLEKEIRKFTEYPNPQTFSRPNGLLVLPLRQDGIPPKVKRTLHISFLQPFDIPTEVPIRISVESNHETAAVC